ncbi:hypothetical protein ScPMuIL_014687 [Solemya velum]
MTFFLCVKTGSGKSLVFEMAPFLFDFIESKQYRKTVTAVVLVVLPLVALMRSQTKILCSRGIKAVYLNDSLTNVPDSNDKFSMDDIRNRHVNSVFGSPESFVCKQRDLLKELGTRVNAIFVDEAHCVVKYGRRAKKNTPAFREAYGRISELRSFFRNRVPIVALTATASKDMVHKIKKDLGILQCLGVIGDPNKENIRYHVKVVNGGLESDFEWLVNLIRREGVDTPRMFFFRHIRHMGELFEILETSLGNQGYIVDSTGQKVRLFDMYHMKTDDDVKESTCASYNDPEGDVSVVMCSTSFSMGMDVKVVKHVVHYGPADDVYSYLQETGRAGRDSVSHCEAVLLKYKHSLNGRHISKNVKDYCKANVCRRVLLLKTFTSAPQPIKPLHLCCDNCSVQCRCCCGCESLASCNCESVESFILSEMESVSNAIDSESSDGSDSDISCEQSEDGDSDCSMEFTHRRPVPISDTDGD